MRKSISLSVDMPAPVQPDTLEKNAPTFVANGMERPDGFLKL
jgi:hypothetical protein